ncbi:efflux RND transporter permease subunit, partial [Chryseobacterium sp. CH1]|uniref:efflux RND transporter permease subunit n=1 Tax=Chryseobacterium sp. CH1 TaxID=713551 RepID=UPI0010266210
MSMTTPKGFIPDEDQSFIIVTANLAPGASKDRTSKVVSDTEDLLMKNPAVDKVISVDGLNLFSGSMSMTTPKGFIPDEDQSFIIVTANLAPGASKDRT